MLPWQNQLQRFYQAPSRHQERSYHRAGDGRKLGEHNGFWFRHNRPAQRARPERRPMVCGKEECTRQCSVCVARLFHRKAIWPHASSRRDALHIGQSVGRCIVPVRITFKNRHMPEFLSGTLTRLNEREYVIESESKGTGHSPGAVRRHIRCVVTAVLRSGIITGQNVII